MINKFKIWRRVVQATLFMILTVFSATNGSELDRLIGSDSDLFATGISTDEIVLLYNDRIDIINAKNESELFSELEENQRGLISRNGDYIGILTFGRGIGDYDAISGFELYERSGKPILKIDREFHTTYFISNSGRVVSIIRDIESPDYAKLFFYRRDGSRNQGIEISGLQTFDFSPDGETFLANTKSDGLIALTFPDGEEIWRIKSDCHYFATSDLAQYTATVSKDVVQFYEGAKLLGERKTLYPFPRDIAISLDGQFTVVADRWNLYAYETVAVQEVWRIVPSKQEMTYVSVDVNYNGTYILAGIDYDAGGKASITERHSRGYVHGYDRSGNKIYDQELHYNIWHYRTPRVSFLPQAESQAIIQTRRELYRLELPLKQGKSDNDSE